MEQKIAELTEKIYKEGVEKGEAEKKRIVDEAQQNAISIKTAAKKEAEKIVADAENKAVELKKNGESEMKLASQQAMSALKQQIVDIVLTKSVDDAVLVSLADSGVIKELIVTVAKNWQAGADASAQVLLSEDIRASLDKSFESSLHKLLKGGVIVKFTKAIKGGFQISPKDGSYKITLSDEDFSEFFKGYLRPKTRTLLFGE